MPGSAELGWDPLGRLVDPYFNFRGFDAAQLARLRQDFAAVAPFPHLVMDNFILADPARVCGEFPDAAWGCWQRFQDGYQHEKRVCSAFNLLPWMFQDMIQELSAPPFLQFLEAVTGLTGLIPDPYLTGGGLHSSGPGGILAPHTDFHSYDRLKLFRVINVLVYLNPEWREEYGASLELFGAGDAPVVSVVPSFGRMVMFLTDDRSIHGFTKPVAGPGHWRNSLALYYYTSVDSREFGGDSVTYWKSHGRHSGLEAVRLRASQALLGAARALSKTAHRLNPNFKAGAVPVHEE